MKKNLFTLLAYLQIKHYLYKNLKRLSSFPDVNYIMCKEKLKHIPQNTHIFTHICTIHPMAHHSTLLLYKWIECEQRILVLFEAASYTTHDLPSALKHSRYILFACINKNYMTIQRAPLIKWDCSFLLLHLTEESWNKLSSAVHSHKQNEHARLIIFLHNTPSYTINMQPTDIWPRMFCFNKF